MQFHNHFFSIFFKLYICIYVDLPKLECTADDFLFLIHIIDKKKVMFYIHVKN